MDNRCKGCYFTAKRRSVGFRKGCIFLNQEIIEKCPCVECLVKVMCNEQCTLKTMISINLFDLPKYGHLPAVIHHYSQQCREAGFKNTEEAGEFMENWRRDGVR